MIFPLLSLFLISFQSQIQRVFPADQQRTETTLGGERGIKEEENSDEIWEQNDIKQDQESSFTVISKLHV